MAKKTADDVYNEYIMARFCGSQLLPKSFYNLSEEDQIKVAKRIKEYNKG